MWRCEQEYADIRLMRPLIGVVLIVSVVLGVVCVIGDHVWVRQEGFSAPDRDIEAEQYSRKAW